MANIVPPSGWWSMDGVWQRRSQQSGARPGLAECGVMGWDLCRGLGAHPQYGVCPQKIFENGFLMYRF